VIVFVSVGLHIAVVLSMLLDEESDTATRKEKIFITKEWWRGERKKSIATNEQQFFLFFLF
jgi:hypothetical protein